MNVGKYKIIEKLSEGSFGKVYKGYNERTNEHVAIKSEPRNGTINSLKHEAKIYQFLSGIRGVPQLKWFGYDKDNTYLVLPYFSETLKSRKERTTIFDMTTIRMVSKSILSILSEIHNRQMVHCDIKPENFLIKNDNLENIQLIDFGFTRRYNNEPKKTRSCIGTPYYMSRSVHQLWQPQYYDDVESAFYVLLFLGIKKLPWEKPELSNNKIYQTKIQLFSEEQINKLPEFFKKFANILKTRETLSIPNYNTIVNL